MGQLFRPEIRPGAYRAAHSGVSAPYYGSTQHPLVIPPALTLTNPPPARCFEPSGILMAPNGESYIFEYICVCVFMGTLASHTRPIRMTYLEDL
ncbi:hypothetical protein J6590_072355 [Homalodisca vitripennis]|nr:hypothetical protein J6590_072355 [Homalodisca vitripennis]